MQFSGFVCGYPIAHCKNTPTITIIDRTFLCKWPNLRNRQGFKYLFSPLYMVVFACVCVHVCMCARVRMCVCVCVRVELESCSQLGGARERHGLKDTGTTEPTEQERDTD